jgi:hypothetical protein
MITQATIADKKILAAIFGLLSINCPEATAPGMGEVYGNCR